MPRLVSSGLVGFLFCALSSSAQTTHVVTLSGTAFSPSALTIEEGDTVRWENTSGFHNVSGTMTDYPGNPVGFRSGEPAAAPFSFEFTFTLVGDYGYHCEVHGFPGGGMFGAITVEFGTGVAGEVPQGMQIDSVYPNPFRLETTIEFTLDRTQAVRIAVFDALGREIVVLHDGPLSGGTANRLEWSPVDEPTGVYIIDLQGETFHTTRKVIRVR